jgi:hypothetical protein
MVCTIYLYIRQSSMVPVIKYSNKNILIDIIYTIYYLFINPAACSSVLVINSRPNRILLSYKISMNQYI